MSPAVLLSMIFSVGALIINIFALLKIKKTNKYISDWERMEFSEDWEEIK